ncbi:GNAT family N-acetyltransferase/peptidase C39 family protein [Alteromonas oceanisediminis]|uniref:GNAT family N-acetyltransferase/peptidase C39 family protein n=1 Tax=Alteromonas oceanisediminis TaxID=2836180 RepID=UPI002023A5F5|nr:GNAT family N-acetyltransferase/peptidase C39 family protein [Alteromonas oceanisediminis]
MNMAVQRKLAPALTFEPATKAHIDALVALENASFETDRLSRQRFLHWVKANNSIFSVAVLDGEVVGYGLVLLRNGTRLARLYSIAIDAKAKGCGIGRQLLAHLETQVIEADRLYMRLEVAANNTPAIALYESCGYRSFGVYANYYENNVDAVRMQKPIRQLSSQQHLPTYPWYKQTTDFTCGPAALLMAMTHLDKEQPLDQAHELELWREATTIYMTTGHGGCHPYGLALAAYRRGFDVTLFVSQADELFFDGVRSEHKKVIMRTVESTFKRQLQRTDVEVVVGQPSIETLKHSMENGATVIGLISTYQLNGYKNPHWVCVTHIDHDCLYIHDSDMDDDDTNPLEYQHIPIASADFSRMTGYGKSKLSSFIVLTAADRQKS